MEKEDNDYYWFIKSGVLPDEFDKITYQFDNVHVGFIEEPTYQIIEKYNLREIGHGSFEWLCHKYI